MTGRKLLRLFPLLIVVLGLVLTVSVAAAQDDPTGRPYLGVSIGPGVDGALVTSVMPDGPAATAGLLEGDIITTVNGEAVTTDSLPRIIREQTVGATLALQVTRGEDTLDLTATLGEMTPDVRGAGRLANPFDQFQQRFAFGNGMLGISVEDGADGIVVGDVTPGSPAEAAELQAGDVITSFNGEAVADTRALIELVRAQEPGAQVTVEFTRDGEAKTVDITLAENTMFQTVPFDSNILNAIIFDGEGWRVFSLSEESPLYTAGLREGDVITQIDGQAYTPETLGAYLETLFDGASVTLTVERDGAAQDITATVADVQTLIDPLFSFGTNAIPFERFIPPMGSVSAAYAGNGRLGVAFVQLDEQNAAEYGVDQTEGALITEVAAESPAALAGLQANDVVVSVNGEPVDAERTLRDRLIAYEPDDMITLSVLRAGEALDLSVTLGQPEMDLGMPFGMPFGGRGNGGPGGRFFEFTIPAIPAEPAAPVGPTL